MAQSDLLCPQAGVPSLNVNTCAAVSYSIPPGFVMEPATNVTTGATCLAVIQEIRDGWFQFTATSNSTTVIATANGGHDVALVAYSGTCGSATMIEEGCVNAGGSGITENLLFTTVPGTIYYIRLIKYFSNSGTLSGTISVLSQVANDDCANAITLTPSAPAITPICTRSERRRRALCA